MPTQYLRSRISPLTQQSGIISRSVASKISQPIRKNSVCTNSYNPMKLSSSCHPRSSQRWSGSKRMVRQRLLMHTLPNPFRAVSFHAYFQFTWVCFFRLPDNLFSDIFFLWLQKSYIYFFTKIVWRMLLKRLSLYYIVSSIQSLTLKSTILMVYLSRWSIIIIITATQNNTPIRK